MVKLTQNDLKVAVALTHLMPYSQAHDSQPKGQVFSLIGQVLSTFPSHGHCGLANNSDFQPASFGRYGYNSAYRQSRTSSSLRRSSRTRSLGLAEALGRDNIHRASPLRNWHRIRAAFHGTGTHRFARRYARQYVGRGTRSHNFSHFLDTTPTLKRRFPCAA